MPPGRGLLVTSGTLHQQPGLFFHLIQSELGDLYKVSFFMFFCRPSRTAFLNHLALICLHVCHHHLRFFQGADESTQEINDCDGGRAACWSRRAQVILTPCLSFDEYYGWLGVQHSDALRSRSCSLVQSNQVSLVVNVEQTEVTDISIEVRQRNLIATYVCFMWDALADRTNDGWLVY